VHDVRDVFQRLFPDRRVGDVELVELDPLEVIRDLGVLAVSLRIEIVDDAHVRALRP
jgi:hypothetical protein